LHENMQGSKGEGEKLSVKGWKEPARQMSRCRNGAMAGGLGLGTVHLTALCLEWMEEGRVDKVRPGGWAPFFLGQ
jgi:hypothetical protein